MATYKDGYPFIPGPLSLSPLINLSFLIFLTYFKLQLGKLVYESIIDIDHFNNVIKFTWVSGIHCHNTRSAGQRNLYMNSVRTVRTTPFGLKGLQIEGTKLWATKKGY